MSTAEEAEQVDIVVVGFGGGGAAAAITAHDLGARALVLEKAAAGGGSTEASGGNIRQIHDVEGATRHFCALVGEGTPADVVAAYARGVAELPDWLRALGAELISHDQHSDQALGVIRPGSGFPELPGAEALGSRLQLARPAGVSGGEAIWALLERNVRERDVPVRLGVTVRRLVRDQDGGPVTGVEVDGEGGPRLIRARGGVVLACGGFSWDAELQRDLFGTVLPALSPPHRNTGDGIRLAQDVGAQLWHMTAIAARVGFSFPGHDAAFKCTPPSQGLFLVDQLGRRYVDEGRFGMHDAGLCMLDRDPVSGRQLRCPSYMVFDEVTRLRGPLSAPWSGFNRDFAWSADNSAEIERGWIHRAGSIAELADAIGVPADRLERTAARYNAACADGGDDLGRAPQLMEPVAQPPFYAVAVWPALLNTMGGPRRDAEARVLDVRGAPIPGLYSAGELGSMWGPLYPGAGNLSEALVTGQVAARGAAAVAGRGGAH